MKRLFAVLAMFFLLVTVVSAQWTTNAKIIKNSQSGWIAQFAGAADSVGQTYATMTSNMFSLEDFDSNDSLEFSYTFTSALGSPKLTLALYGSDVNQAPASMVLLKTFVTGATAETETLGSFAFGGIRARYLALKVTAVALGRPDQTFVVFLKAPKRDY